MGERRWKFGGAEPDKARDICLAERAAPGQQQAQRLCRSRRCGIDAAGQRLDDDQQFPFREAQVRSFEDPVPRTIECVSDLHGGKTAAVRSDGIIGTGHHLARSCVQQFRFPREAGDGAEAL